VQDGYGSKGISGVQQMIFITESDGSVWLDIGSIAENDPYIYDKLKEYLENYNQDYDVIHKMVTNG
jgi:hypothetical protein